jgi:hypothetical protein
MKLAFNKSEVWSMPILLFCTKNASKLSFSFFHSVFNCADLENLITDPHSETIELFLDQLVNGYTLNKFYIS